MKDEYPSGSSDLQLFINSTNGVYTQNDTNNRFKTNVLDVIYGTSGIEKDLGGSKNAPSLVNSRGTIFEGNIVGHNGQPPTEADRVNWYQESYILSRYKTLTNINATNIDQIRKNDIYEKVIKYYEFMEFKKAKFKCTAMRYDDNTGRVVEMSFEIKE